MATHGKGKIQPDQGSVSPVTQVKHIGQAHPQCYKLCSAYALVKDGEGGFLLVFCHKNIIGFESLREDADIDTVPRVSYFKRAYANIKHHRGADHRKSNTLLDCIDISRLERYPTILLLVCLTKVRC